MADFIYSKDKPLSHMRIAITAIDLEQAEHRGIAYLSKGLISSLYDLGAEVYLLTGFYGSRLNPVMKMTMSKQSVREVDCADILDQFCDPSNRREKIKKKKYSDLDEDFSVGLTNLNFSLPLTSPKIPWWSGVGHRPDSKLGRLRFVFCSRNGLILAVELVVPS